MNNLLNMSALFQATTHSIYVQETENIGTQVYYISIRTFSAPKGSLQVCNI
jgi:chromosome condensin MukBEF complex kleisin-like MukF subunit